MLKKYNFKRRDLQNQDFYGGMEKNGMFVKICPDVIREENVLSNWYMRKPEYLFFKKQIQEIFAKDSAINNESFWAPMCDPHVAIQKDTGYKKLIYFNSVEPAVGMTYKEMECAAKFFYPEANSRIATKQEFLIFLAWLTIMLVRKGFTVEDALKKLCICKLLEDPFKAKKKLQKTGKTNFFDLSTTSKILAAQNNSGYYYNASKIANLLYSEQTTTPLVSGVPFVICSEFPNFKN